MTRNELLDFRVFGNENDTYYGIYLFMNLVKKNNLSEYTKRIYDDEALNKRVLEVVKNEGWQRAKTMIKNIKTTHLNYYYKDFYGNFRNITNGDISDIIDDIDSHHHYEEDYEL